MNRQDSIGIGHGAKINVPARAKVFGLVNFRMPVHTLGLEKPTLNEECKSSDQIQIYLQGEIDISLTRWSGKTIPLELFTTVACRMPIIDIVAR